MKQSDCIKFIFSDIEPLLITKGDHLLLAALKEELGKETFAESLAEFLDGCWLDLDGRIVIHLDEWLESDDDNTSLLELFDQHDKLHIEELEISKDLWNEQILDLIRDNTDIIKKGFMNESNRSVLN